MYCLRSCGETALGCRDERSLRAEGGRDVGGDSGGGRRGGVEVPCGGPLEDVVRMGWGARHRGLAGGEGGGRRCAGRPAPMPGMALEGAAR